jgi:hypothetical protein
VTAWRRFAVDFPVSFFKDFFWMAIVPPSRYPSVRSLECTCYANSATSGGFLVFLEKEGVLFIREAGLRPNGRSRLSQGESLTNDGE